MDETKVLELALESCQSLERSLNDSLKMVRRLNIRYNTDWLVKNYQKYLTHLWDHYRKNSSVAHTVMLIKEIFATPRNEHNERKNGRSSNELCGCSCRLNYRFIKIKRSMEALVLQIQRAIDIANRQKNFIHLNLGVKDSRERLCCH